jgi:hypothetical protein
MNNDERAIASNLNEFSENVFMRIIIPESECRKESQALW